MQGDLLQQIQVGSTVPTSFSAEFNVPDDARVLLRSSNGSVTVGPSGSGRLEVEVKVAGHVSLAGTKRLATRLRPSEPYMILETEYEDTGIRASADYVIGLPAKAGVGLTVEMLNGSFRAESLPCSLDVSIHNGNLTAERFDGDLHARLINGSVRVTGSPSVSYVRAGGSIELEVADVPAGGASVTSLTGDIAVRVAGGLGVHLAARSGLGQLRIGGLVPENVSAGGGSFQGDLGGGGPRLALNAVSGALSLAPAEGGP